MPDRSVTLIVQQAGNCALIKQGDRWPFVGRELKSTGGVGKLCAAGMCSVYPKLVDVLKILPDGAPLPDDLLMCDTRGCDALFRMQYSEQVKPYQAYPSRPEPKPVFVIPPEAPEKPAAAAAGTRPLPPTPRHTDFIAPPPAPQTAPAFHATASTTRRLERGAEHATNMLRKQGPFLSRLAKDVAAELIGACATRVYEDGQIVLMQGVVGDHLHLVGEGTVEVARQGKAGEETILVTLGPGECFGEMSILTGDVTTAEVRARGKATILAIHKDNLETLLVKRPGLSREFSKLLAGRLKATNSSLENELSRGVLGKLSMIPLLDLVQALHQGRRTGTLVLNYTGKQTKLGFRNGNMVTATLGETRGEEAFYQVVCWPDGDFCFEAQTEPKEDDPGKIATDLMGLMMEGMRRLDELKAASGVPMPDMIQPSPPSAT